jgi:hypothetical protein
MSAGMIQIVLLWIAVFIGLDLTFGEGVFTNGIEDALEHALRWLRQLLGSDR